MLELNKIYHADYRDLSKSIPDNSIDLIVTSPPYGNARKSTYGGINPDEYLEWLRPIAKETFRVLKPTGSFILNIGDNTIKGETHLYTFEIPVMLKRELGFKFIDAFIWHKKVAPPGKFYNRFKDAWDFCFHFTKTFDIKFYPERVAQPTKQSTISRALREKEVVENKSQTGSGFTPRGAAAKMKRRLRGNGTRFSTKDDQLSGLMMALPSNVLHLSPVTTNVGHSAPFPVELPEFFIKAFSDEGDIVLDPFAGSATTCIVAKKLNRNFIGIEAKDTYFKNGSHRYAKELGLFA